MEKIILCAILAVYAVFVDIQAAMMLDRAYSIHDFQVLPMLIWAVVVSVMAIAEFFLLFRKDFAAYRRGSVKGRGNRRTKSKR